jgi:hypothetical protein
MPEQPAPACRWLDRHKTKSHIWLSHVTSVVIVTQQDGDKKGINNRPTYIKAKEKHLKK